jgi:hypothetical protein
LEANDISEANELLLEGLKNIWGAGHQQLSALPPFLGGFCNLQIGSDKLKNPGRPDPDPPTV